MPQYSNFSCPATSIILNKSLATFSVPMNGKRPAVSRSFASCP